MTEESPQLHPNPTSIHQHMPQPPQIKQEAPPLPPTTIAAADAAPADAADADDEIDTMPFEELQQLYQDLQNQFKTASLQLSKAFEEERNQRKTLSYYERRNQAILNILECIEENSNNSTSNSHETTDPFDTERIRRIVEKAPRLAKTLSPLTTHRQFSNVPISSNLYLIAYLMDHIPDLIDDDLTSIEINPQSIESWCRRNRHSIAANLVSGASKPITIEMLKRLNEYNGVEFDLGIDGKLIVTPQAASSSSKKRRRK